MKPTPGKRATARIRSRTTQPQESEPESAEERETSLLSALLQSVENFTAPQCPLDPSRPKVRPAEAGGSMPAPLSPGDETLSSAIRQIHTMLNQDPSSTGLLSALDEACRQGKGLSLLTRTLFPHAASARTVKTDAEVSLTRREQEVLREAGKGHSYQTIANDLGIEPKTVNKHLENAYRKLGVNSSLQATARAVELGYFEMDAIDVLLAVAPGQGRRYRRFDTLCDRAGDVDNAVDQYGLRSLADFGALLLITSHLATRSLSSYAQSIQRQGIICELDAQGQVVHRFGLGQIGTARCIVQAPPHAAKSGFAPGNLFVAFDCVPQQNLNRGAVAEFTPEGEFVQAFSGAPTIDTRLVGPLSMAFAADGALLVSSGLLTDAILRFDHGGRTVRRFASAYCEQIAVGPQGDVYGAQHLTAGSHIMVHDAAGQCIGPLNPHSSHMGYAAVAVEERGRVYAAIWSKKGRLIEVYAPEIKPSHNGETKEATWDIGGINEGLLTLDSRGRLYVPCSRLNELKIVTPDGVVARRFDLGHVLKPWAAAASADGRIWVCGRAILSS